MGSNVVERSKKHWVGRPITRETAPYTGRYKSKQSVPTAEEYQTADGVPFPVKTGKPCSCKLVVKNVEIIGS